MVFVVQELTSALCSLHLVKWHNILSASAHHPLLPPLTHSSLPKRHAIPTTSLVLDEVKHIGAEPEGFEQAVAQVL